MCNCVSLSYWCLCVSVSVCVSFSPSAHRSLGPFCESAPYIFDLCRLYRPHGWPRDGTISVRNVCLRYASKGPDVLRNVDLDIEPGSFVGVVGRTGGGKSSLASVLLRLALPHSGRVLIDGIDATKIGLHALRRHVGYLPQTPWIFEGSLRENLDLTDSFSDDDIMQALADAGILRGLHRSRRESTYMSEGGAGIAKSVDGFADDDAAFLDQPMSLAFSGFLSTGQMQLLCFARLLLQRPQVFILDEGTMMAFIFVYVSPFCARMRYDSLTMMVIVYVCVCVCVCVCAYLYFSITNDCAPLLV